MPSVVVNVVKYERANYSTLGDLLTTITTSHQHIIVMEIVIPRQLQHYPVRSRPKRACCVMAVTAWALKNQHNKGRQVKEKKKKRGETERDMVEGCGEGGLEQ